MKNERLVLTILRWAVMLAGYGYLAYRLATFDSYDFVFHSLYPSSFRQVLLLLCCVALMVLNLLLEAYKWYTLVRGEGRFSFDDALKGVLYGNIGAFVTPYRAGDLPARLLQLPQGISPVHALAFGIYGGVVQTAVIAAIGIVPALLFLESYQWHYLTWLVVGVAVLGLFWVLFLRRDSRPEWMRLTRRQHVRLLIACTARYTCWLCQFILLMLYYGMEVEIGMLFVALPTYYLLVTVTPNMPVADAGIRGSWAVFVLGHYGVAAPLAAITAVSLWFLNTVLPMVIYPMMRKDLSSG